MGKEKDKNDAWKYMICRLSSLYQLHVLSGEIWWLFFIVVNRCR
jgi:hypothetical protein